MFKVLWELIPNFRSKARESAKVMSLAFVFNLELMNVSVPRVGVEQADCRFCQKTLKLRDEVCSQILMLSNLGAGQFIRGRDTLLSLTTLYSVH